MKIHHGIIILCVCFLVFGCKENAKYRKTLEFGKKNIKWAEQMESWYGGDNVDHMITHYNFEKGKPVTWTSIAYLYGRYELWLKVEIKIDYENSIITNISESPEFFLFENESVEILKNGQVMAVNADPESVPKINQIIWEKIEKKDGDIAFVLGLNKNAPLRHFAKWRETRGEVVK